MPDLPAGTVTFLVTDIAGATRLLEQHPDAMRDALARYDILIRSAVNAHRGSPYLSAGDNFASVFTSAPDAVAAAVAAQRALRAEDWGEIGTLQVAMALDTGAVELRNGQYTGAILYRLYRLLDTGYAGQILLSQATQELTRERLPKKVSLRDLGEHRLKDLIHPVRIYQVVSSGLPAEFPSLKTLDRPDTTRLLRAVSQEILSRLDREAILGQLTRDLPAVFPAAGAALFLLDPAEGVYRQPGITRDAIPLSSRESMLLLRLQESSQPVTSYGAGWSDGPSLRPRRREPAPTPPVPDAAMSPPDRELARRLGAVLWVPLMFQGRLVGTLALGRKRSGEAYTEEEVDALCLVANEAALALETAALSEARERQARLQQELAIARSIQMRLLPPARLSLPGYEILSRTEPSTEVGGDFYNLFEVAGSGVRDPSTQLQLPIFESQWQTTAPAHLGILVGDVAGKGVPAALFMAVTTTLIQGQAQLLPSPAATLAAANAQLNPVMRRPGGGQPLFATAVYGVLGVARSEIRLANAGQTPPIHWPASGEPRYLRLSGTPLGALPTASYEEQVIRLAPGDRLLLCSDGFIESLDAVGEPVGYDGFLRRLAALRERGGPELIDTLFGAAGEHKDDPLHRDDRTVVLITALPEGWGGSTGG